MNEYYVEYKDSIGDWHQTGPVYRDYADALDFSQNRGGSYGGLKGITKPTPEVSFG